MPFVRAIFSDRAHELGHGNLVDGREGHPWRLALPHVLIAVKQRGAWVNLLFAIAAVAVAGTAVAEMAMMHAQTTKQIGRGAPMGARASLLSWSSLSLDSSSLYFGTGRMWLGGAACVLRLVTLVINFAQPPNLNFHEITSLRRFDFLGETLRCRMAWRVRGHG